MTTYPGDFGAMPVDPLTDPGTGVVTADVPCRKCQYNLRGLPADGRCPECGTPVGYSTRGDFLRFSEPTWVGTLKQGVSTILWAIVVIIFGAVAGGLLAGSFGPLPALLLGLAGGLLSIWGAWQLTTPDPSGLGEEMYGTSRKVIRVTLAIGLFQAVLNLLKQTVHLPPTLGLGLAIVAGLAGLSSVVGTFAQLNYLSKLALRIPDQPLSDRARLLMYGYGIPLGVIVLVGLGIALLGAPALWGPPGPGRAPGGGFVAFGCVGGIAGLALLVFGIMYLFMLGRFSRRFGEQAAIARATWARAGG